MYADVTGLLQRVTSHLLRLRTDNFNLNFSRTWLKGRVICFMDEGMTICILGVGHSFQYLGPCCPVHGEHYPGIMSCSGWVWT